MFVAALLSVIARAKTRVQAMFTWLNNNNFAAGMTQRAIIVSDKFVSVGVVYEWW